MKLIFTKVSYPKQQQKEKLDQSEARIIFGMIYIMIHDGFLPFRSIRYDLKGTENGAEKYKTSRVSWLKWRNEERKKVTKYNYKDIELLRLFRERWKTVSY